MINRGTNFISRLATIFAVIFTITACGGGGGGDSFYQGDDGNENSSLQFALYDPAGNSTTSVTSSAPGTLTVTVRNGGANILVSAETSIGTLFPATGSALTDRSGVATFQLEAGTENGSGIVSASATVNEVEVTGTFGFNVGETGLRLGYFDADGDFIENQILIEPTSTLSAGGNAQLSVVVLTENGDRVTTAEAVRFTSGCIAGGLATINPSEPKSVNGQASTLYSAAGCAGTDQITASLIGASAQASGSISIAAAQANALNFVSATPELIVLRGTGGVNRDETSDVVFQVVDSNGKPLAGVTVALSLTTEIGGLSLSRTSALSNGEGQVKTTVTAGDVATTARVIATVNGGNGETVATSSDLLTVTTGLPDQNSISLSAATCDDEIGSGFIVANGMTVDGITCAITVSMADKFNNPVVDGTAAVFTTEYGAIVGTCTTVDGTCSVDWRSQEPRFPAQTGTQYVQTIAGKGPQPESLGYTVGGRSTIIVRAQGEESFIDSNGNGVVDEAEQFVNLPEAFIDNNEDDAWTPGLPSCVSSPLGTAQCKAGLEETFFDFNNNGVHDLNNDPAVYNGLLCPPEGNGVWCSRELVEVRDDIVLTLGGTEYFARRDGNTVYFSDFFNNPPPQGSTVALEEKDGCKVAGVKEFTVPNLFFTGAFGVPVNTTPSGGTVTVTLKGTGGIEPLPLTITCTPAPIP